MMGFNSFSLLAAGWCLHAGFVIISLVGVVLFVVWAMRLKAEQLKTWVIWLLVIGMIGGLLTAQFSLMGWRSMMNGGGFEGSWKNMMNWSNETPTPKAEVTK